MTVKQEVRALLVELREMARLEASCCADVAAVKVWLEVQAWAEGVATSRKIDLALNATERLARQRRIFP